LSRRFLLAEQAFTETSAALARIRRTREKETMGRQAATVLYVLVLVAVVVGVDLLFFRHHFWERLIVNVGIVLVFAAFGLRFLKRP
jgi:protein-S-isoprenylcysteine O-methyltransferase Ste14